MNERQLAPWLLIVCALPQHALGGQPNDGMPTQGASAPVDVWIPLNDGGEERVFLQAPTEQPPGRPLILVFHGAYYEQHWDNPHDGLQDELRALFAEATRRGWYVVSVNGGEARLVGTYGGPELHRRTTAVIRWMEDQFRIDRSRIYTLGYSMGGIDAVNYAARHVDPEQPMIAAVWCWSGALCAEVSEVPCNLVPCNPLARIAASAVQTTCQPDGSSTGEFVSRESLAWNLEHAFLTTTTATRDIVHVTCPAPALRSLTSLWMDPERHRHLSNYGKTHNDTSVWNPEQICNFFDGKSVELPVWATRTVCVEDARYFYFDVTRRDTERPGVMSWNFEDQHLTLSELGNLATIELDMDGGIDSPLDSRTGFVIDLESDESPVPGVMIRHFNGGPPVGVWCNDVAVASDNSSVWSWDDGTLTLLLHGQPERTTTRWRIDVR